MIAHALLLPALASLQFAVDAAQREFEHTSKRFGIRGATYADVLTRIEARTAAEERLARFVRAIADHELERCHLSTECPICTEEV
jgi:hypothetical protein